MSRRGRHLTLATAQKQEVGARRRRTIAAPRAKQRLTSGRLAAESAAERRPRTTGGSGRFPPHACNLERPVANSSLASAADQHGASGPAAQLRWSPNPGLGKPRAASPRYIGSSAGQAPAGQPPGLRQPARLLHAYLGPRQRAGRLEPEGVTRPGRISSLHPRTSSRLPAASYVALVSGKGGTSAPTRSFRL